MKTLYLLRHAKSDWETNFSSDHERGLATRGKNAAKQLAGYMEDSGFAVNLCYVSDAKRCVDTWKIISKFGQFTDSVVKTTALYESDFEQLVTVIQESPNTASSLLMVGHNPGLEMLAEYLIQGVQTQNFQTPLFQKFPTTALLGISLPVEKWNDIRPGQGSIIFYWIPGRKERKIT
jgi:phosphohistidine phosphatase